MEPIRACPICPKCGSKKFQRLEGTHLKVRCVSCNKVIEI